MAPLEDEFVSVLVLSLSVSKYTQMLLTNIVTGHNLLQLYKSSGKGDRRMGSGLFFYNVVCNRTNGKI